MIVERILEAKAKKIKQYPVNANRASELGHPCLRYLVLNRTRWQEKTLHDARLQMIFDMGRMVEDLVFQDLREAGFAIVEQQRPFSWPKYQITGSIDFKIAVDGQAYPCEVKSAAPNAFASINSVQDMLHHKWPYMRKYPAQLTLYLLMDNKERGLFLFKNKSTGEIKEIWLDLDFTFAESLVQKAEAINKHVAEGTLPDPMEYSEDICRECGFVHICLPDRIGKEVEVTDDGELLGLVTRYTELKPGAKEFDEVNERITELVKGREKILVGDYFIEGKWQARMSYDIPQEIKAQYQKPGQFWKKDIMKVEAKLD
jgi:CRISPR/Cas system-associated exonuclease Cas4 (RecB family)